MKRCAKCGETKPLDNFTPSKRVKCGREPRCKPCRNADARDYRQRTLAQRRAYGRAWVKANQEKHRKQTREWAREWRKNNPEKAKAASRRSSRQLRKTNPDYHRERYWQNPEEQRAIARETMRRDRLLHPERERERKRRYREANLAAVQARELANTHRRRAHAKHAPPGLAAYMAELRQEPCVFCDSTENITVEHLVPISRGGGNDFDNLVPACRSCNSSKQNLLLEEWMLLAV